MKKVTISQISVENYTTEELSKIFSNLQAEKIACCNWLEQFPYTPDAEVKAFHNGEKLFLQFSVTEKDIHSVISDNFGEVWTDPCVEFFVAPDEEGYYNFECTCIGRMLVAHHRKEKETEKMPLDTLATIERYPSLGNDNFPLREGENRYKNESHTLTAQ